MNCLLQAFILSGSSSSEEGCTGTILIEKYSEFHHTRKRRHSWLKIFFSVNFTVGIAMHSLPHSYHKLILFAFEEFVVH